VLHYDLGATDAQYAANRKRIQEIFATLSTPHPPADVPRIGPEASNWDNPKTWGKGEKTMLETWEGTNGEDFEEDKVQVKTTLMLDNAAALVLAYGRTGLTARLRHLNLRRLHVKSLTQAGLIFPMKVPGEANLADPGTKALSTAQLKRSTTAAGFNWRTTSTRTPTTTTVPNTAGRSDPSTGENSTKTGTCGDKSTTATPTEGKTTTPTKREDLTADRPRQRNTATNIEKSNINSLD
jgi:hypothetical protein